MARGPPCLQRQTLGKLQEVAAIIAIDSNIGMTVKAIVLDDGFWQSIIEILHVAMGVRDITTPGYPTRRGAQRVASKEAT